MIPVDAQIWTEADVRRDGFSLETVLGEINSRGAGVKIALIDASRRNPFERRFRSFSAGLAPVIAPNGTLVMYSAALVSVVSDNGSDRSLFVRELLKEIRVPDLMAEETLNRTRVGVTRASRSEQVPWISSSLAEDFSFIPGAQASRPRRSGGATADPAPPSPDHPQPATAARRTPPPPRLSRRRCRRSNRRRRRHRRRLCHRSKPHHCRRQPEPAERSRRQTSLADDPTIKSLTEQAQRQSRRRQRAVPARTGLCQQGRICPCHQGLRQFAAAQSQGRRGLQQPLLGPHRDRRPAGRAEGLQRGAAAAPEFRRCAGQPRPRQPQERADQECDR